MKGKEVKIWLFVSVVAGIFLGAFAVRIWGNTEPRGRSMLAGVHSLNPVSGVVKTPAASSPPLSSTSDLRTAITQVAKVVGPAVVNIGTKKGRKGISQRFRRFFGEEIPFPEVPEEPAPPEQSLGSGFIITPDGYIVTNAHVVKGVDEINVKLTDGNSYEGKLVGLSEPFDIAVVRINAKETLPTAAFGDSDALEIGEWVVAIGNPFGFDHTVTQGIISGFGRPMLNLRVDLLQTDAAINPGNSGGPLVNLKGEVVGVNTAILASAEGISFAIPGKIARRAADEIIRTGKVEIGYLGVWMQDLTEEAARSFDLPEKFGVFISKVEQDSPAEKAGIQAGDVLLKYQGEKIKDSRDLREKVVRTPPGTPVDITLLREKTQKILSVKIASLPKQMQETPEEEGPPEEEGQEEKSKEWGMTVKTLTSEEAKDLGISPVEGVLITRVELGTPASRAGLEPNQVIVQIEGQKVQNIGDYRNLMKKYQNATRLGLHVKQENNFLRYLILKR